ncbi:MAG: SDR family NAD(P)-dependent oxidoreductase [Pseudomonadota bacterium]
MRDPRSILITGANSGIGKALAEAYAAPNRHLFLTGRDEARLSGVCSQCEGAGASVTKGIFDVTDRQAVAEFVLAADAAQPLDLVIANAGISGGGGAGAEEDDQVRRLFSVNVDGVFNTIHPAIAPMMTRGRGQLAIVSSLAGFRGLPGSPAYSATKAAVRTYGEGLAGLLADSGVSVSVICPGFVRTPLTDVNPYKMPFLMEADKAADIIIRGLSRGNGRIAFPWPTYLAVWALQWMPDALAARLLRRMPRKPSLYGNQPVNQK